MFADMVGSGGPVGVGYGGEGGLGTLRTIAAAWPPPPSSIRVLLDKLICSVTAAESEGARATGGFSSAAARRKWGSLSLHGPSQV